MDIHRLPSNYATLSAVWAAYPQGGQEGDYFYLTSSPYPAAPENAKYRWNKYAQVWESAGVVIDDSARETTTFSDVNVQNNLNVGGSARVQDDLFVEGVLKYTRIESNDKGMYALADDLRSAYPNPKQGWWASVINGSDTEIWIATGNPVAWSNTHVSGADLMPDVISDSEMAAWLS